MSGRCDWLRGRRGTKTTRRTSPNYANGNDAWSGDAAGRVGCNGGVTGNVLEPSVEYGTSVVILTLCLEARRFSMQTRSFPSTPDGRSPAGAEIRYLIEGETGAMIHSTVPPGQVNRATVHATVSEFWHVLSGEGQIWRRNGTGEETTVLGRGVSIDIPVGTAFQYRCTGVDPLQFLCITMPRWPGDKEATVIEGPWKPTAPEG
jgi:mannose-6-phosphate isomerase-like protein (cupin superfamily)